MKHILLLLFIILELSGPIFGVVAAISMVAGLICWGITGNEHSVFGEIIEFCIYGIQIYGIWFFITGLISLAILFKKDKH